MRPRVVLAVLDLMRAIGFRPFVAPFRPNGKPLHVHGFLGAFTRAASRNASMLRDLAATGVELVGVDASMTLTYRSEYGMLAEADRPPPVLLLQEWLARHRDAIPKAPKHRPANICCCLTAPSAPSLYRASATGKRHSRRRARACASCLPAVAEWPGLMATKPNIAPHPSRSTE